MRDVKNDYRCTPYLKPGRLTYRTETQYNYHDTVQVHCLRILVPGMYSSTIVHFGVFGEI